MFMQKLLVGMALALLVHGQTIQAKDPRQDSLERRQKLSEMARDPAGFAARIVSRWEQVAAASGKWDEHFTSDMQAALMKLSPQSLLRAEEAPTFEDFIHVVETGHHLPPKLGSDQTSTPAALGDVLDDMVYTPVSPCRIADTRKTGGPIRENTSRGFDVDGTSFLSQGGFDGSCGIPYNVARAVVMNITATNTGGAGYFTTWAVDYAKPNSSVLNYAANQTIANTTVIQVTPGAGVDFNLYVGTSKADVILDVLGYFASPVATELDCTDEYSSVAIIYPNEGNEETDVSCPAGSIATGGGYVPYTSPDHVTVYSVPNGNGWRTYSYNYTTGNFKVQTFARCCRVPGR